jgi:putative ABC transport system permease protein
VAFRRKLRSLWHTLFRRSHLDRELDEELQDYLEGLIEQNVCAGMDPAAARKAALIEMGGLPQVRADVQRIRSGAGVLGAMQDMRFAARSLVRRPAFAIVAICTFALGIGANSAIFSVVNAVLIRPLPYENSAQLGLVYGDMSPLGYARGPLSGPELKELQRRGSLFTEFGAIWANSVAITGDGEPQQLRTGFVTANFFRTLGVSAAIGRTFQAAEEGQGAPPAIVLSWATWQRLYGGDPAVVGRKILVYGTPTTIVGVMPADFRLLFPREASIPEDLEVWIPFDHDLRERPQRQNFLRIVGRLKTGVPFADAKTQVSQIAARIVSEHDYGTKDRNFNLVSLQGDGTREIQPRLLALSGGVIILLLVSCLNVSSLLLARATSRTKETAVRVAIGASRSQIFRQCLVEGLLLAVAGGAVGVVFGELSLRVLLAFRPAALSRLSSASLDSTALAFTAGVALLWGVLFSLAPMLEVLRADASGGLWGNTQRTRAPRYRTRAALVVAQIAFSAVLLIGAGLMIRSFVSLQRLDLGYKSDRLLTFRLYQELETEAATNHFHREFQADLLGLPGIESVGSASHVPFDSIPNWGSPYYIAEGQDDATAPFADFRSVSPGYMETIGAALVEGRFFTEADGVNGQHVVIVDDLVAKRSWPGESAIGKKIAVDPWVTGRPDLRDWKTVIGVVRHMRIRSMIEDGSHQVYMPIRQVPRPTTYVVRTSGDPAGMVPAIRSRIRALNPPTPVSDIRPMEQYLIAARSAQRFTMFLATAFASVAVALAFVGVYGLITYSVNTRSHEFGIRLALGAQSEQIRRMVLHDGLRLVVAGLAVGIAGAALAARLLEAQLFGVTAYDIPTYIVSIAVILCAGLIASLLPAHRASALNVLNIIRAE